MVWAEYKKRGRICESVSIPSVTPKSDKYVRFVCISDTHDRLGEVLNRIPAGDVLIHAGKRNCTHEMRCKHAQVTLRTSGI